MKQIMIPWLAAAVLGAAIFLPATGVAADAVAATQPVVVLTSYPEALTIRYQRAFEAANPQYAVQVVWAHSSDAKARLQQPGGGGVDVYWTPAPAAFAQLAGQGRFAPLHVDRAALPGHIGQQPISDAHDRYQAFEVAGYGFALNAAGLRRRGLVAPQSWSALARPEYAGQVLWPDPARVGFAPALYDIILQAQGWNAGWALLSEAIAQEQLTGKGGQIVGEVASDALPIGLSVDFLVRSAAANGEPVSMAYPRNTAFLPAQVAVLATAPHPQAAQAFAHFVLSASGQALLFEPDIARYPVRPAVYTQAPKGTFDPFARAADAGFAYDPGLEQARSGLVVALFTTAISERLPTLRPLWRELHAAEARQRAHPDPTMAARLKRVRALLGAVPVSPVQADSAVLQAQFHRAVDSMRAESTPNAARSELVANWRAVLARNAEQARALLASLPAS